jgi:hypothetical protein
MFKSYQETLPLKTKVKTIHQYRLQATKEQVVQAPKKWQPLGVRRSGGQVVLSAIVIPTDASVPHTIRIVATCEGFPDADQCRFLGTITEMGNAYHVFLKT